MNLLVLKALSTLKPSRIIRPPWLASSSLVPFLMSSSSSGLLLLRLEMAWRINSRISRNLICTCSGAVACSVCSG